MVTTFGEVAQDAIQKDKRAKKLLVIEKKCKCIVDKVEKRMIKNRADRLALNVLIHELEEI